VPKILPLALAVAVVASLMAGAAPAQADTARLGNDVSAPQCRGTVPTALPAPPAFAILGVNGGVANTSNPCLAAQLAWAQTARGGTKQPIISFYVNTANPGLAASWWPATNQTQPATDVPRTPVTVANPYGLCTGLADAACAYVYGYSMALDDTTIRGVPVPGSQFWWLDVETINTWSTDKVANRASLEGMAAQLQSIGATVGLYSTNTHWFEIVGSVPKGTRLDPLPSWVALGPVSEKSATKGCGGVPLTNGGRIAVTQFVAGGFDYDVSCLTFTSRPKAKVVGAAKVGKKLTVKTGSWHPSGVKITYRWYRNGVPITKAVHAKYTLKKVDGGTKITVTVTAKKAGYSTVAKTSTAKKIAKK